MKKFLHRLLIYFLFLGILILSNFFIVELIYPKIDFSDIKNKFKNINADDSIKVFIGGDSRAERQIIPEILNDKFGGVGVKNLACGACEITRFKNFFENTNFSTTNKILILSTSIFQVNESINYFDPWYSLSSFNSLNVFQKYNSFSFKNYLIFSIESHKFLVKEKLKYFLKEYLKYSYSKVPYNENGFRPVKGFLDKKKEININMNPLYSDIHMEGIRWLKFTESIYFFSNNFKKTYILIPPPSKYWKKIIIGTFIDKLNQNFIRKTKNYIKSKDLKNIVLIDFYNDPNIDLLDIHFYDMQHTNSEGAKVFTKYLSGEICF